MSRLRRVFDITTYSQRSVMPDHISRCPAIDRHSNGMMVTERVEVWRLSYIDTLHGSRVYGEFVINVVVLVIAFIDFVEDISDLSYLSHVAAILFRKVRALAEEVMYVTAADLFAQRTSLRSWDAWGCYTVAVVALRTPVSVRVG